MNGEMKIVDNNLFQEIAIRVEHVTVQYDIREVLSDVSLNIPRGAVVGLIGANGSGKSTLLRSMVGLLTPQQGMVSMLDCPALSLTDAVRNNLGYVAQSPDLFAWMSVAEHIKTIGQAYTRWNERQAIELALRMQLPLGRSAGKLSGGDQQKLAVVLALAHQPALLILDEPVASLDPLIRRDFMRTLFLDDDTAYPRTIVISSHILTDLERVVSHVAFMREGRLQLFESWDAVLEYIRVIPKDVHIDSTAVIHSTSKINVVDTRLLGDVRKTAPNQVTSLMLDELFIALNS
jgi:ABC-2 type transport system ATP-binding protein